MPGPNPPPPGGCNGTSWCCCSTCKMARELKARRNLREQVGQNETERTARLLAEGYASDLS